MKLFCLGHNPSANCFILKLKGIRLMLDCGIELSSLIHFLPLSHRTSDLGPAGVAGEGSLSGSNGGSASGFFHKQKRRKRGRRNAPTTDRANQIPMVKIGNQIFIEGVLKFQQPQLGTIDLSLIDVILISNPHNMLALPFITQYTPFRGKIYATEPALQTGRMLMTELVSYLSHSPTENSEWQNEDYIGILPPELEMQIPNAIEWRGLYKQHDVDACVAKIEAVSFNQAIKILGTLQVTALSSGFSIGSANWLIQPGHEKIIYMAESSSASSRHPQPLDTDNLMNVDVLLLTGLTNEPQLSPDLMLQDLCNFVGATLNGGGNVIIPSYPSGIILDLLDYFNTYLSTVGLGRTPMYFLSPVGDQSLAYANIVAEWLCKNKQDKAYLPEMPFIHTELQENGRLMWFKSAGDTSFSISLKTPCIVFCGHPSLRCGDVVHLLHMWRSDPKSSILFIEPDFNYVTALLPYQPVAMRTRYCPIDPRLDFTDTNRLLHTIRPKHLVIPTEYSSHSRRDASATSPQKFIQPLQNGRISHFTHLDVLKIPLERSFEKATMHPELAMNLTPKQSRFVDNAMVANVAAVLSVRDNQLELVVPSWTDVGVLERSQKREVWGRPAVERILQALMEEGITGVRVERKIKGGKRPGTNNEDEGREKETEKGKEKENVRKGRNETRNVKEKQRKEKLIIYIELLGASVVLTENQTEIRTEAEDVRNMLKRVILRQCTDFSQLDSTESETTTSATSTTGNNSNNSNNSNSNTAQHNNAQPVTTTTAIATPSSSWAQQATMGGPPQGSGGQAPPHVIAID